MGAGLAAAGAAAGACARALGKANDSTTARLRRAKRGVMRVKAVEMGTERLEVEAEAKAAGL